MEEPEWVALGEDNNGITINQYFITHPEMVLGTMAEVSGPYGMETACLPLEGADLAEQLEDAAVKIHGTMGPAGQKQNWMRSWRAFRQIRLSGTTVLPWWMTRSITV